VAARRCSQCAINWATDHRDCPVCLEETAYMVNATPIGEDEARALTVRAEFDRYYEEKWPDERDAYVARLEEQRAALDALFAEVVAPLQV
jgi:hypothetical protein